MSIPLLIGIVGHRDIPEEYLSDLESELSKAIDSIRVHAPNTPLMLATSLAEGADRAGARVGLKKGLQLVVPLPFETNVFEQDFPNSTAEFRELLQRAERSFVAVESEFRGYEGASRWIARHCQIIIAFWDGTTDAPEPGGTAHTVLLRNHVGESGHLLTSVADYLGPVLHLHCPREPDLQRRLPNWIWPESIDKREMSIQQQLYPLDEFNADAATCNTAAVHKSMSQLPHELSQETHLARVFGLADCMANHRQRKFLRTLNASVFLAIVGYGVQQIWPTVNGRIFASLILTAALIIIYLSNRVQSLDRYLEYRALAEVLRIAFYWRLSGISATPTDRFLNQHWGNLHWVRSAVNALWIPSKTPMPNLDLVKTRWIDDQQTFHENRSFISNRTASHSRLFNNACFVASVLIAWLSAMNTEWAPAATTGSGLLLLMVGASSHYSHTRGWEEDASRYRSMAAPFSWCQKIWLIADEKTRRTLVQELGGECVTELSNWLLAHRNRPVGIIKG